MSEGVRDSFWLQGMMGGLKGQYDCIHEFAEVDYTSDLKKIDKPTLVLHGDDDQIVPIDAAGRISAKIVPAPSSRSITARPMACRRSGKTRSTQT